MLIGWSSSFRSFCARITPETIVLCKGFLSKPKPINFMPASRIWKAVFHSGQFSLQLFGSIQWPQTERNVRQSSKSLNHRTFSDLTEKLPNSVSNGMAPSIGNSATELITGDLFPFGKCRPRMDSRRSSEGLLVDARVRASC